MPKSYMRIERRTFRDFVHAPKKKEKREGKLKDRKDEGKIGKKKKKIKERMVLREFQEALKYPKLHVKHTLRALGRYSQLQ